MRVPRLPCDSSLELGIGPGIGLTTNAQLKEKRVTGLWPVTR